MTYCWPHITILAQFELTLTLYSSLNLDFRQPLPIMSSGIIRQTQLPILRFDTFIASTLPREPSFGMASSCRCVGDFLPAGCEAHDVSTAAVCHRCRQVFERRPYRFDYDNADKLTKLATHALSKSAGLTKRYRRGV